MTNNLHALIVEDHAVLTEQIYEILHVALQDYDIELTYEAVARIEPAKELLTRGQGRFGLVIVDLLWKAVGPGSRRLDARGLEVIKRAARTEGVVIVAVSIGDTRNFPELEADALAAGADIFRLKGALTASARGGGWEGLAAEIASRVQAARGSPKQRPDRQSSLSRGDPRVVFVVHGRDDRRTESVYRFLRAVGLAPLEWPELVTQAIRDGEGGNPHIFSVIRTGFNHAFGAVVIFTADDEARLRSDLRAASDPEDGVRLRGQARQNVLLETGYALCYARERTLIVTLGDVTIPSDLDGMHMLRLDDTSTSRNRFVERLRSMGFAVSTVGDDWLRVGDFA